MTEVEALKEVMTRYDEYRARWIAKYGNDKGFDKWFTLQIENPTATDES